MEYSDKRIQISRSKHIEESRALAVLRLNEYSFLKGELNMLNYYKDPDFRTDIGVLVAIGVKDGIGEDCYRILSGGGIVPVRVVTDILPDVSKLVHDELYVYKDEKNVWNYVYKKPDADTPNRIIEPITDGPFIFLDLETGYRWFYEDQVCKREDDFFSTEKVNEVLQVMVNLGELTVNVASKNGYVFKVGDVKNIHLEINAVDKKGDDFTDKCDFYIDDTLIKLDENNEYTYKNLLRDKNIIVEARYKVTDGLWIPFYGEVDIRFGYDFFYGRVKDGWKITKDSVESLEKKRLNYRRDLTWDNIVMSQDKIVFSYPKRYGYLNHIYDINGLDYIYTYQAYDKDIVIDDEEYLVYVKKDVVTIDDFKQTFVFSDVESITAEEGNLIDLLSAWKDRNKFSGLVMLDENGKIPEELYNPNASSTFTEIVAIVTEFPSSGLTVGEVYYNEATKEMFTAISETSGVISEPKSNMMYVYDNEFYSWTGDSLQPFARMESRIINTIEEELYGRN